MDSVDAARRLVDERFPNATAAFLAGSVLTTARTPTSDLDIVVIRTESEPVFRETLRYADWPVELFVQTPTSYERFLASEIAGRRSPLLSMISTSVVLVDREGDAAQMRADAQRRWAKGPPPATIEELEDPRYNLSDLLDDLDGADDPDEMSFIAVHVFTDTARLALTVAGAWLGGGKWLSRRLHASDTHLHAQLTEALRAAATGNAQPLRTVARQVLDRAGGPLLEGYHRQAPPDVLDPDKAVPVLPNRPEMAEDGSRARMVWVFHGERARFASGVFDDEAEALAWVARHRLTGLLTQYPVGDGCYDIALATGRFRPSKAHHGTPAHVAGFSPDRTRHIHVHHGQPDS